MDTMNCPRGHGAMLPEVLEITVAFKGEDVPVREERFVCPTCRFAAGAVESAGKMQAVVAEAYRRKTGLLSGEDIKTLRKEKNMTQEQLAERMDVGIASIKRWETGAIQSRSMDDLLRRHLEPQHVLSDVTGNRHFSISRIRLVAEAFKDVLGRPIIKANDKMLYAAKYLWYADMMAKKMLGRSMTGATYAHLTYGPQLNNYRDLLDEIQNSDLSLAEPLTVAEQDIIRRIARVFPKDRMVYEASHKEPAWLQTSNGELILYSWADSMVAELCV